MPSEFDLLTYVALFAGGIIVLYSGFKIISKGMALLFWLMILGMGLLSVNFGLERGHVDVTKTVISKVVELIPNETLREQAREYLRTRTAP